MKKSLLILLAAPFFLLSCQETLDELSSIGTFKSTFTGDVAQQFDGSAAFVHNITTAAPEGSILAIGLSKLSDQSEIIALGVSNLTADGVNVGTYNLGSSETLFLPSYTVGQESHLPDPTLTNEIVISSVDNTRVKGTFEVNLIEVTSLKKVKIIGTFDALGTTEEE